MTSASSSLGRRLVVLVATLAGVALTAALGVWQLNRASQKEAIQQALASRADMPVLSDAQIARQGDASAQYYRRARLTGRWLAQHTIFLDNRQMNGRPGFFVLTPLWLNDAKVAVVVQRGWVPRDAAERTRLPVIATPEGEISVEGRIVGPPSHLFEFSAATAGLIRQNVDLAAYSREVGVALAPLSLLQESGPDDGLLRQWARPAADIYKHYGYAFQWFALCALMAGLYVWHQLIRPRRRRSA